MRSWRARDPIWDLHSSFIDFEFHHIQSRFEVAKSYWSLPLDHHRRIDLPCRLRLSSQLQVHLLLDLRIDPRIVFDRCCLAEHWRLD